MTHTLNQLYFYLTDACNLRCRHCWIEPRCWESGKPFGFIGADVFESVLEQAQPLGLTGVKLTGGEPFLHPQIEELLDSLRTRKLRLTVETNGTLVTSDLAASLADFPEPSISVSLDGADEETHDAIRGKTGSFRDALRGIELLTRNGIRPQIIMTLMRCNCGQLADMAALAESLGACSVKFNILQPTARGERLHEGGESLDIASLISLGQWVDEELSTRTGLSLCFHQPPAFRSLGKLFGEGGDGCHACGIMGILGVLADGSFALCGIGASVPDMIFGHASKDALADIWLHHPTLQDIRRSLPQNLGGVCGRCFLKHICLGSCIAQNFYRRGTLWAPFWFCEDAQSRGLFPPTRLCPESMAQNVKEVCND